MSQITLIISQSAQADLARIYQFLLDCGAIKQAKEVMQLLKASFIATQNKPNNGKAYILTIDGETLPNVREVSIAYGKSGYRYLFHYDEVNQQVLILTLKHFRENRYRLDSLVLE